MGFGNLIVCSDEFDNVGVVVVYLNVFMMVFVLMSFEYYSVFSFIKKGLDISL